MLLYALIHCMNLTFLCMSTVSLHSLMFLTKLSAADYVGNVVSSVEPIGGVTNSSIGEKPKNTTGKLTFYFSFSLLLCFLTLISKCFNHLPE